MHDFLDCNDTITMLIGFMTFRQLDPSSPHAEVHKIMFSNEARFRLDLIAPKGNENESSERGGGHNLEVCNIETMMRH